MTVHVTPSHDGSSYGGASASVRPLIFANMLPRKRDTEGEQMGMATTRLGWERAMLQDGVRDLTMGQRKARLEVNAAEWRKATGLGDG